eukprot:768344-Hanusia_phi.AAC.7
MSACPMVCQQEMMPRLSSKQLTLGESGRGDMKYRNTLLERAVLAGLLMEETLDALRARDCLDCSEVKEVYREGLGESVSSCS